MKLTAPAKAAIVAYFTKSYTGKFLNELGGEFRPGDTIELTYQLRAKVNGNHTRVIVDESTGKVIWQENP